MKKTCYWWVPFAVVVISLSGCVTTGDPQTRVVQDPVIAVPRVIKEEHASDARYLRVRKREFLIFDGALQTKLEDYRSLPNLDEKRKFLLGILTDAKQLGDTATEIELKRIPADRISSLANSIRVEALTKGKNAQDRVLAVYIKAAAEGLSREMKRVEGLKSDKESDRYARDLGFHIEISIKKKGRTFRQIAMLPLAPFARLWMGYHVLNTPHAVAKVNFQEADYYRPELPSAEASASGSNHQDVSTFDDQQLLAYYAPVIAIEKRLYIKYDPQADHFGEIAMQGENAEKVQPKVNVGQPTVYTYAETKMIQGTAVKVLVYTLWFPERPQLNGRFDPEVGSTQGSIIRITLGKSQQPLIYENVSSCGCYYKIFPSTVIEKWAKDDFAVALSGKHFVIENKVARKIDADVPSLANAGSANSHLIAFYAAGTHDVIEIQPNAPERFQSHEKGLYKLLPYETLENLPFHQGTISMFDKDGLVRCADRLEAKLLAASGIFHPGTPRQRGTLMIYFDQADFDDPHLLEKYLRLPAHAFTR